MKVTINQSGVKRQLDDAPFELCLDAVAVVALKQALERIDESKWSFGWILVFEAPIVHSIPNAPPLPWTMI